MEPLGGQIQFSLCLILVATSSGGRWRDQRLHGVDAPYEPPQNPEITLPNYKMSIQEYVRVLRGVAAVVWRGLFHNTAAMVFCVYMYVCVPPSCPPQGV